MPQKRKRSLPPLKLGNESLGERLAVFRKQRGLTQTELAQQVGVTQPLVSDYERGRLQLSAEMAVRFAMALKVSCDDLLGVRPTNGNGGAPPRRLMKRVEKIQRLSVADQRSLLRTIDGFLRGV
jgi:transcriptional regulator with XRE-family HTH domain